jgi:formylglycine-generating enzyme required for sulfatase activity
MKATDLLRVARLLAPTLFGAGLAVPSVGSAAVRLMDYYYPAQAGATWLYQGRDWDGNTAHTRVTVASTAHSLTLFGGRRPPVAYTQSVVSLRYETGNYSGGAFLNNALYDEWFEYVGSGNAFTYYGSDDDGEHLRADGGFALPETVEVGDTVSDVADFYAEGAYSDEVTLSVRLVDTSAITVPAGTFSDAIHLRITFSAGRSSQVHEEWWARGVGMVKMQGVSGDGSQRLRELISTSAANTAPTITTHPQNITVPADASASFTVAASGTPTPTYQWERKPSGSSTWSNLTNSGSYSGATTATLTVSSTTPAMSGDQFRCVASNGVAPDAVSSIATLAVVVPPAPTVSNVRATQRPGTGSIDITYDLAHTTGAPCTVEVWVSSDGGVAWTSTGLTLTGAVGAGVTPGTNKAIVWHAGADWPAGLFPSVKVRVKADDAGGGPLPTGYVRIPATGATVTFTMGDPFSEGDTDERPVHTVWLSAFAIATTEVTWAEWKEVRDWAVQAANGYDLTNVGAGKADSHPVNMVSWWEVVKWLNAKSQKESRTPCYYTDSTYGTVLKTGEPSGVAWKAGTNGYRLPTEAEWECAARGGVANHRFPWSDADTITHQRANYFSMNSDSYDTSSTGGYHPTYSTGGTLSTFTSPVGAFAANDYGLFDMAGNVWEWCWDWHGTYGSGAATAPTGPASGSYRVSRGGSWGSIAYRCRSADRSGNNPGDRFDYLGFRPALSSVPP